MCANWRRGSEGNGQSLSQHRRDCGGGAHRRRFYPSEQPGSFVAHAGRFYGVGCECGRCSGRGLGYGIEPITNAMLREYYGKRITIPRWPMCRMNFFRSPAGVSGQYSPERPGGEPKKFMRHIGQRRDCDTLALIFTQHGVRNRLNAVMQSTARTAPTLASCTIKPASVPNKTSRLFGWIKSPSSCAAPRSRHEVS